MAHLLVHGLGQHGFSPGAYPLIQLLADLQDLGFTGEQGERFMEGRVSSGSRMKSLKEEIGRDQEDVLRQLEEGREGFRDRGCR